MISFFYFLFVLMIFITLLSVVFPILTFSLFPFQSKLFMTTNKPAPLPLS